MDGLPPASISCHAMPFDPMTTLIQHSGPDGLTDFRTPALDLGDVYARRPGDQPYIYDKPLRRNKMVHRRTIAGAPQVVSNE